MNDTVTLPLTVFIVDDEPPARNRLKDLLTDCSVQFPLHLVGEAGNGREALDKLAETPAEVVLMDIRMPQMDGIELARHLNKLEHRPVIIFTTAYDAYAIQAFEQHAIDYLLKPIRLGRLFDALSRARDAVPIRTEVLRELTPEPRCNLSTHERGRVLLIPIEQVLYLRAELEVCHGAYRRTRIPHRRIAHRTGKRICFAFCAHPSQLSRGQECRRGI